MTRAISSEETPGPLRGCTYRWGADHKLFLRFLTVVLLCGAAVLFAMIRNAAVESARYAECQSRLKAIGLALRSYGNKHGSFPPAYFCDKTGTPTNSWRLLVADLAFYHRNVTGGYDVSEPWNAPSNSRYRLCDQMVDEFQCPSARNQSSAVTNYVAVIGPNTIWSGCRPMKPAADRSDSDKILLIEVVNSDIRWTEPRDLTLEQALDVMQPKKGVGIGSAHHRGINYLTVGGEVRTLDHNIDRESLRQLMVRDRPFLRKTSR